MEGYKRNDQNNKNKDGIEEDVNTGGIDIPDQALATFANGTDETDNNDSVDDDDMQTWYHTVEIFLEHINKTSQKLVE